jgi:hypothetical protein
MSASVQALESFAHIDRFDSPGDSGGRSKSEHQARSATRISRANFSSSNGQQLSMVFRWPSAT